MPYTSLDKALIDRTVRGLQEVSTAHKALHAASGAWPNDKKGQAAKRRYDALARDAADLKALSQRMINEVGDSSVEKYIKKPGAARPSAPREPEWKAQGNQPLPDRREPHLKTAAADLGEGAGTGFPTTAELMAGKDGRAHLMDYESDLSRIGQELEPFEQGGKAPGDLADQAAAVVGNNG